MSRTIPTINTARLTLRAMRAEDFTRFATIWAMPEVVTHISGKPRSKAQSWDAFLRNAGHWQISGFGQWAIQPRGAAEMEGQCGFFFGSRKLGADFDPYPEAGWLLASDAQGKGLGLEAVQAAHDWFDRVIAGRTVCMIAPENTGSLRIAEAVGYQSLRQAQIDGETVDLMTRKGPPV
ncbi:Acetyltransferase, GNAT family protein [Sulfitobacter noctilucae]|uniref:GNAT family N-acetyltransferase n=1 Tax=Sulfitobacter noctilucae TaxID=1342302 RepID=UPI000468FB45|nr:GNAT family N-acetyltransferase [Sulfitobacter noctilucae]KIN60738.1 Acetyltransferase, GNAT family protein [Sulfitobacter noctilucae]